MRVNTQASRKKYDQTLDKHMNEKQMDRLRGNT